MQYINSTISLTLKVLQIIWISVFQCTDMSHKDVNAVALISNSGVKENVDTKTDVVLFKFSLLVLYVLAGILGSCLKLLVIPYGIFIDFFGFVLKQTLFALGMALMLSYHVVYLFLRWRILQMVNVQIQIDMKFQNLLKSFGWKTKQEKHL